MVLNQIYDIYKDKTVLVLDYNNVKYKNFSQCSISTPAVSSLTDIATL